MLTKKALKEKLDIEESKSNERMRRKGGQDESVAKAELALKEANKDAIQRKMGKHFSRGFFSFFLEDCFFLRTISSFISL